MSDEMVCMKQREEGTLSRQDFDVRPRQLRSASHGSIPKSMNKRLRCFAYTGKKLHGSARMRTETNGVELTGKWGHAATAYPRANQCSQGYRGSSVPKDVGFRGGIRNLDTE